MSIGQKIRELRRQNDMTQEQLADLLGISYQAISKWETDVSSPDLSMIVPLARLFHVSTDVLFGMDGENARRAEFDALYEDYWKKDIGEMYAAAQQAAAEFPGDYKYLEWLASMEFYVAFDDDYLNGGSKDFFNSMLEKSKKHYEMIIEGCTDSKIRQSALHGIILDLKNLERLSEAKKYAELFPEEQGPSRDMMLELCTDGEDLLRIRQKIVYCKVNELLHALEHIWNFPYPKTAYVKAAVDIAERLIKMFVPDQNYYRFYLNLYNIYLERAGISMAEHDFDSAVNALAAAKDFAQKRDSYNASGKCQYTCTLFDHVEEDLSCELPPTAIDCWRSAVNSRQFHPLRERDDFQKLIR